MDIRPIRDEADYQWALKEIEPYFTDEPALGSPESDRFDVLAILIEAYENRHHPLGPSDPVRILHYAIEDLGRSQTELADLLGSRSRASEILNRKRCLTLEQAHRISTAWHLPLELLAVPYRLEGAAA
ncbi:helix-turn-helix domain-containing protein [Methylobacterium sp. NEAU 140]|uniref:helix-turn-helix domain-containing protein n=1 Tax=Methylobacterium sp. NEAU 140 TaxID=3064945 RepID=UPI00273323DF|nr:helix-turn-helix domain-containing protein [Methylobacterium sp. NEAU 140]MDP4026772.1 helix-turn-helix domain-containing protein [Methylobacterium sp. NEAU 140]